MKRFSRFFSHRLQAAMLGVLMVVMPGVVASCAPKGPTEIAVAVTDKGFEPASVHLKKGSDAVLVITRKVDDTCATDAIFATTGRKYSLPLNTPVRIELPTEAATTIHYACGMGMYSGEIVIDAK